MMSHTAIRSSSLARWTDESRRGANPSTANSLSSLSRPWKEDLRCARFNFENPRRAPASFPPSGVYPLKRRRQNPQGWQTSAAELGLEDGSDPRAFHDKPWNKPQRASRKASQLCGQVTEALHAILSGMADESLQNLTVVKVEPAPNTGRLRVTVAGVTPADATDPTNRTNALAALERAGGLLRMQVARAIHRKYAPELAFHLV